MTQTLKMFMSLSVIKCGKKRQDRGFWKGASEIEVTGGSMSLTGEEQQQRGALLLQAAEKSSMPL